MQKMNRDTIISIYIGLGILAFAVLSISILYFWNEQNGLTLEKDWKQIKSNIDLKTCKQLGSELLDTAQQPYITVHDDHFYEEKYRYITAKIISGDCQN